MDSESDSDYIARLIDERKQLRVEIDDLRIEALRLAIDADILNDFSDLKDWYPSARSQGLVHSSSWSEPKKPEQLDSIRQAIDSLIAEIRAKKARADQITHEIRTRTS
jgi:hypothetical protein